jgi:dipeptidyl aminopeptidase/acylaminoacyl peptidase
LRIPRTSVQIPGAGYIVAFPNPHGSNGYGQDYCDAISGDWGGKVFEDLMKVTGNLSRLPYVDKERMGATAGCQLVPPIHPIA